MEHPWLLVSEPRALFPQRFKRCVCGARRGSSFGITLERQRRRREDASCCGGHVSEAADDCRHIDFIEERVFTPAVGALRCAVKALPKNRRSPGVPHAPQHEDGQDVLLPAEIKQSLSALKALKKASQSHLRGQ